MPNAPSKRPFVPPGSGNKASDHFFKPLAFTSLRLNCTLFGEKCTPKPFGKYFVLPLCARHQSRLLTEVPCSKSISLFTNKFDTPTYFFDTIPFGISRSVVARTERPRGDRSFGGEVRWELAHERTYTANEHKAEGFVLAQEVEIRQYLPKVFGAAFHQKAAVLKGFEKGKVLIKNVIFVQLSQNHAQTRLVKDSFASRHRLRIGAAYR